MNRILLMTVLVVLPAQPVPAHDVQAPKTIEHYALDPVGPHIHVVHGPLSHPLPANHGFMNNPAAIVTAKGVILVDPGSSRAIGRELVAKVRKLTSQPVIAVFNTHVHGDHWLGNDGVREAFPDVPIYAHERMIARAQAGEGKYWVGVFDSMTKGKAGKTQPVIPAVGLKGGETFNYGDVVLRVHFAGHAHSDNDLLIEVKTDRSLFTGDVVVASHVPNSDVPQDASFKGSISAIEKILTGPYDQFVPGHGKTGGREVPEAMLRFHRQLYGLVKKYYQQGLQDFEMTDRIIAEMSEYRHWHNFSEMGRVIGYVYREIERDSF